MTNQTWKEKFSSWFSLNNMGETRPKKWIYLIFLILCLPIVIAFFTVFVGIIAILSGVVFILLVLFFLAPEIVKGLAQRGILHAKTAGYVSSERTYMMLSTQSDDILLDLAQPVTSVSLKIFKSNIYVQEHDEPNFRIQVTTKEERKLLSFFTHYDEMTSTVTVDQGPVPKTAHPISYDMTIFIPTGRKIKLFNARVIEGLMSLRKMQSEQAIETLDIDVVNVTLLLENLTLPILKVNALNLILQTKKIFVRYSQINAASSQICLNFDQRAIEFVGKIKCHTVLSNLSLNKKLLTGLSGSTLNHLWGDGSNSPSIMLSANLLRSDLYIIVPEKKEPKRPIEKK